MLTKVHFAPEYRLKDMEYEFRIYDMGDTQNISLFSVVLYYRIKELLIVRSKYIIFTPLPVSPSGPVTLFI